MRWELSQEQVDFAAALRGWLAQAARADFDRRLVAEGWAGVGFPEELGGQGGGLVELALVAEELGRAAAPGSRWLAGVLALPTLPSNAARRVLGGDGTAVLATPADTVPGTAPPARAGPQATGVVVEGILPRVLGAAGATSFVVPAFLGADQVLVLVEAAGEGVTVRPMQLLDPAREAADVHLQRARGTVLDAEAVPSLQHAALRGAVLVAADALGAAEQMLDLAVAHTLQRRQFGRPVAAFQAVQHAAAEMLVSVEAARSIVFLAAASVEAGHEAAAVRAATAKAQVTASMSRLADDALTLHGAIGYTWEHDLQLFYKRAKLDRELLGRPEVWNERIAEALLTA